MALLQGQLPVCMPCTDILHLVLSEASRVAKADELASKKDTAGEVAIDSGKLCNSNNQVSPSNS